MNLPSYGRLIHQVDVQLVDTEHTDNTGSIDVPEATIMTGVNCLIEEASAMRADAFGRELERKGLTVTFYDLLDLKQGHILTYTNPSGRQRRFLVDAYCDDLNMGRIWYASCTEVTKPAASP